MVLPQSEGGNDDILDLAPLLPLREDYFPV